MPGFHGHLAHLGWPWVDECIATLAMETFHAGPDPADRWQLKADLSFGCPPDWQVESVRRAMDMLPANMLMYASDCFWPCEPSRYLEEFVFPQLATVESAATLSRTAPAAGTAERIAFRRGIFHDNAWTHWLKATRGKAQDLVRRRSTPRTPHAWKRRHEHQQAMRSPASLARGPNQPTQELS